VSESPRIFLLFLKAALEGEGEARSATPLPPQRAASIIAKGATIPT